MGGHYFLLSRLPPLPGAVDDPMPITLRELRDLLVEEGAVTAQLARAVLAEQDLYTLESNPGTDPDSLLILDGHTPDAMPDLLLSADDRGRKVRFDTVWERYFRWVLALGAARSTLLHTWARYNLGLRNALVRARAQALNLDAEEYTLLPEEEDVDADFPSVMKRWQQAPTPLLGELVLDRARWDYLTSISPHYSFATDEVVDYAIRILLMARWAQTDVGRGEQVLEGIAG